MNRRSLLRTGIAGAAISAGGFLPVAAKLPRIEGRGYIAPVSKCLGKTGYAFLASDSTFGGTSGRRLLASHDSKFVEIVVYFQSHPDVGEVPRRLST